MDKESHIIYKGECVPREHFRVFVYDKDNKQKLANSYEEYLSLTSSGLWFDDKSEKPVSKKRKK